MRPYNPTKYPDSFCPPSKPNLGTISPYMKPNLTTTAYVTAKLKASPRIYPTCNHTQVPSVISPPPNSVPRLPWTSFRVQPGESSLALHPDLFHSLSDLAQVSNHVLWPNLSTSPVKQPTLDFCQDLPCLKALTGIFCVPSTMLLSTQTSHILLQLLP